jgi:uncharacterized membrane protein YphA (DoxX/SURF4 family)
MGPTPMMQLEIWMTIAGRVLVAAIFLLNAFGGIFPRLAALALLAFIVSESFIAYAFWLSAGPPNFQAQLVNFFKNVTTRGLLLIATVREQPILIHLHF